MSVNISKSDKYTNIVKELFDYYYKSKNNNIPEEFTGNVMKNKDIGYNFAENTKAYLFNLNKTIKYLYIKKLMLIKRVELFEGKGGGSSGWNDFVNCNITKQDKTNKTKNFTNKNIFKYFSSIENKLYTDKLNEIVHFPYVSFLKKKEDLNEKFKKKNHAAISLYDDKNLSLKFNFNKKFSKIYYKFENNKSFITDHVSIKCKSKTFNRVNEDHVISNKNYVILTDGHTFNESYIVSEDTVLIAYIAKYLLDKFFTNPYKIKIGESENNYNVINYIFSKIEKFSNLFLSSEAGACLSILININNDIYLAKVGDIGYTYKLYDDDYNFNDFIVDDNKETGIIEFFEITGRDTYQNKNSINDISEGKMFLYPIIYTITDKEIFLASDGFHNFDTKELYKVTYEEVVSFFNLKKKEKSEEEKSKEEENKEEESKEEESEEYMEKFFIKSKNYYFNNIDDIKKNFFEVDKHEEFYTDSQLLAGGFSGSKDKDYNDFSKEERKKKLYEKFDKLDEKYLIEYSYEDDVTIAKITIS